MLYFIPWVVFLVLAIVAVPVAMMMEKGKRVEYEDDDSMDDEFDNGEPLKDGGEFDDGGEYEDGGGFDEEIG